MTIHSSDDFWDSVAINDYKQLKFDYDRAWQKKFNNSLCNLQLEFVCVIVLIKYVTKIIHNLENN